MKILNKTIEVNVEEIFEFVTENDMTKTEVIGEDCSDDVLEFINDMEVHDKEILRFLKDKKVA